MPPPPPATPAPQHISTAPHEHGRRYRVASLLPGIQGVIKRSAQGPNVQQQSRPCDYARSARLPAYHLCAAVEHPIVLRSHLPGLAVHEAPAQQRCAQRCSRLQARASCTLATAYTRKHPFVLLHHTTDRLGHQHLEVQLCTDTLEGSRVRLQSAVERSDGWRADKRAARVTNAEAWRTTHNAPSRFPFDAMSGAPA